MSAYVYIVYLCWCRVLWSSPCNNIMSQQIWMTWAANMSAIFVITWFCRCVSYLLEDMMNNPSIQFSVVGKQWFVHSILVIRVCKLCSYWVKNERCFWRNDIMQIMLWTERFVPFFKHFFYQTCRMSARNKLLNGPTYV